MNNPVSELSVEEGNKLIAEFMGFRNVEKRKTFAFTYMKYHSSWDWLMPVWYKLWYESNVLMDKDIEWAKIKGGIARLILYGSVLEAFEEIAKAIQWYNQINKP